MEFIVYQIKTLILFLFLVLTFCKHFATYNLYYHILVKLTNQFLQCCKAYSKNLTHDSLVTNSDQPIKEGKYLFIDSVYF